MELDENLPIVIAGLLAAGSCVYAVMSARSQSCVSGLKAHMDAIDAARATDEGDLDIDAYYRDGISGGGQ